MEPTSQRETAFNQYPDALYPIRNKEKWGYMNRLGEVIIKPIFDDAQDFKQDMAIAAILENEHLKYGTIDKKGNWIVGPQYDKLDNFSEGFALAEKNELYGYIDSTGKVVISIQFEDGSLFSEGYAAVRQGGYVGFINTSGKMVIKPSFTCSVNHPVFRGGLAPVFEVDEQTGFIDTSGQWVIEPIFYSASIFREDKAWAMTKTDDSEAEYGFRINGGFIGRDGQYTIGPEYDFGWDFSESFATVWKRSDDKMRKIWKVIDGQGEVVLDELPYRNVGSMKDGLIPIQDEEMHWGFMNIKGEVVIPTKYSGINHFENGLARMETGSAFSSKIVYINEMGEVVWKE